MFFPWGLHSIFASYFILLLFSLVSFFPNYFDLYHISAFLYLFAQCTFSHTYSCFFLSSAILIIYQYLIFVCVFRSHIQTLLRLMMSALITMIADIVRLTILFRVFSPANSAFAKEGHFRFHVGSNYLVSFGNYRALGAISRTTHQSTGIYSQRQKSYTMRS